MRMKIKWPCLRRRKRDLAAHHAQVEKANIEILQNKTQTHNKIEETKKVNDRLSRLLKANGITLRIHIATGGHKHVR
jgi:Tfp pilus assembly PilM family ATPase